jgi:hypothetical protein
MAYRFTDGSNWSQCQNARHHMDPAYRPVPSDEGRLPDGCKTYPDDVAICQGLVVLCNKYLEARDG